MDLNDFWQENKRYVLCVLAGVIAFFIAQSMISSRFTNERRQLGLDLRKNEQSLRSDRYTAAHLKLAEMENELLKAAVKKLSDAVQFRPRPEYVVQRGAITPANQYFLAQDRITAELTSRAARARAILPAGLGLEAVESTRDEQMVRRLEALDLIERVISTAIDSGVGRVDKVRVRLDPALGRGEGVGPVERTSVQFDLISDPGALVRLLTLMQSDHTGQPIPISELEVTGARAKTDEVRAKVTFQVVRLTPVDEEVDN